MAVAEIDEHRRKGAREQQPKAVGHDQIRLPVGSAQSTRVKIAPSGDDGTAASAYGRTAPRKPSCAAVPEKLTMRINAPVCGASMI